MKYELIVVDLKDNIGKVVADMDVAIDEFPVLSSFNVIEDLRNFDRTILDGLGTRDSLIMLKRSDGKFTDNLCNKHCSLEQIQSILEEFITVAKVS